MGLGNRLPAALALQTLIMASGASAQYLDRGLGVLDRPHPELQSYGVNIGSLMFRPEIQSRVNVTDNFFATKNNAVSDTYLTLSPKLFMTSNWSRHRIEASGYYDQTYHFKLNGQNSTQYGGSFTGEYDITRQTSVTFDADVSHGVENRTSLGSFQGATTPIYNSVRSTTLSVSQDFNHLSVDAGVSVVKRNYTDASDPVVGVIDQDFRDLTTTQATAKLQYDLSSGLSLIVDGVTDRANFRLHPGVPGFDPRLNLDRRSKGYNVRAGLGFELSSLIFGTVQIGYLTRDYRDPLLKDIAGFSYNIKLLWNATPLTSVTLTGNRAVEESASLTSAGNTRSQISLVVDHELYRFLIISANMRFSHFSPNGPGLSGNEYGGGLTAKYSIDRRWSLILDLSRAARTGAAQFRQNMASLSARFAL